MTAGAVSRAGVPTGTGAASGARFCTDLAGGVFGLFLAGAGGAGIGSAWGAIAPGATITGAATGAPQLLHVPQSVPQPQSLLRWNRPRSLWPMLPQQLSHLAS